MDYKIDLKLKCLELVIRNSSINEIGAGRLLEETKLIYNFLLQGSGITPD